jgi:Tfp pilus assembly protein FimT
MQLREPPGATVTGLPAGVTGTWLANVVTISGTPTASGPFTYTVTLTGGCGVITTTGTITVTANNTVSLTSAVGTDAQTVCINTAITNITYATTGATGATVTGLPAGVTGTWLANVVTISGTPTVSGPFTYTVTLTGGCGVITTTGTITVTADNTVSLTSPVGTDAQTVCINTAITNVTYATTGATGATVTGLPAGVTGTWLANVVTISGTPTASGPFTYTVTLTGGCGVITTTGTITVTADNTVSLTSPVGTDAQTVCINTAITNITYATTGATGATVTGLPAGVTGTWLANVVTISGTPTASGPFTYTVTLTGGCGVITTTGTITVTADNTVISYFSSWYGCTDVCINTAITNVTYATTGATGATVTGLPAGVTGTWLANVVTISGIPTALGPFTYTVTLTGGCGVITTTGTITVTADNTVSLTSPVGTDAQTTCINTAITNITYATTGATGATVTGLPAGVTGTWLANVVTISGTPMASGPFTYTVTLTGGCGVITTTGTITVTADNTVSLTSPVGTDAQTVCINTAITNITYATTGATGATVTGLPAGVTGTWLANVVTISGTPTASGPFTYTVTLTGGCGVITTTGTITVTADNTVSLTSPVGTDAQTACINTAITNITYATTGATGATVTGLPAGVTGTWLANVVTISGTPTASGPFTYTVTLTGGCGVITTTGTITVTADNTVSLTSPVGTDAQTVCINTAITNVTYATTGATGATVTGLPAGVTGTWLANVVTISGTPTASGPFTYTVTLTGGCGVITTTGTITVAITLPVSVSITADVNPVCAGTTVNFTATPTNGGTTPAYQWYNGATAVGTNSPTYSYIPVNGDVITVVLTSNETCQSGGPATSNMITMTVNSLPTVTTTQVNVACFGGTTGTATALPAGGTGVYTYTWNTIPVQTSVTATGLAAGTYIVTVADGNSCTATASTIIIEPATALSGSVTSADKCFYSGRK